MFLFICIYSYGPNKESLISWPSEVLKASIPIDGGLQFLLVGEKCSSFLFYFNFDSYAAEICNRTDSNLPPM